MSNLANQIKQLYEQGNSPVQIAEMLDLNLADVLLVLNSIGCLNPARKSNTSPAPISSNSVIAGDATERTAADIFKENETAIAQKIVNLAMSDIPEHAGVAAKCAIYAREEVTGRNDARAKRNNGMVKIINIDKLLIHQAQTKDRLANLLGMGSVSIPQEATA